MSKGKSLGILAALVAAALVVSLMAANGTVLAGRGANAATRGSATLTVSPNPAPLGTDTFLITGAGFTPGKDVMIDLGVFPMYTVTPDGSGAFSLNFVSWSGGFYAGEFTARAEKYKGQSLVTVASTTFTVCSTNPCQ